MGAGSPTLYSPLPPTPTPTREPNTNQRSPWPPPRRPPAAGLGPRGPSGRCSRPDSPSLAALARGEVPRRPHVHPGMIRLRRSSRRHSAAGLGPRGPSGRCSRPDSPSLAALARGEVPRRPLSPTLKTVLLGGLSIGDPRRRIRHLPSGQGREASRVGLRPRVLAGQGPLRAADQPTAHTFTPPRTPHRPTSKT